MRIKIQCACGTRYAFDIEPVNGQMPYAIHCPNCQTEGTAVANTIIANSLASVATTGPATPAQATEPTTAAPGGSKLRIQRANEGAAPTASPAAGSSNQAPVPAGTIFCHRHTSKPAQDYCFVCKKPICSECMSIFGYLCSAACRYHAEQTGIKVPVYRFQKQHKEEADLRKGTLITAGVILLLLTLFGGWIWYADYGRKPRVVYKFPAGSKDEAYMKFLGADKAVVVEGAHASLHDLKQKKDLWSVDLKDEKPPAPPKKPIIKPIPKPAENGDENSIDVNMDDFELEDFGKPRITQLFVQNDSLWFCLPHSVQWVDASSGQVKQTIAVHGMSPQIAQEESGLLVVSTLDPERREVTHIDFSSGATKTEEVKVPRSQKKVIGGDELPPNVEPTAALLLNRALDDRKNYRVPTTLMSSEFFSAGKNLVELRVKLLEVKTGVVQTMKAKGPTVINGELSASTSHRQVAEEIFNDIKRAETGGYRETDESRYEVRLRRWLGDKQPDELKLEIISAPHFFPLNTVDLIVADKLLIVVDKQNKKLFESKLSYSLDSRFGWHGGGVPAVEKDNVLYFFDQGVLTAFDLPGGSVRWRLTSVGISHVQFDDAGMLYVNTTTASPEDIQFSEQITFEKVATVILKVDPANGKTLWKAENLGRQLFISGKYLLSTSATVGGLGLANALSEAFGQRAPSGPAYFHMYRLDPKTGKAIWDYYREEHPGSLDFKDNKILLRFGNEAQLMKFWTF